MFAVMTLTLLRKVTHFLKTIFLVKHSRPSPSAVERREEGRGGEKMMENMESR